jgi:hypothetical protein
MKYRGLSVPDDPLSHGGTWSWGGPDGKNDPFVRAVKEKVRESTVVYNGSLPHSKFAVVELQDKKPVALYFDADGDGEWQVAMTDGPVFATDAARTSRIEIGRPALSIRAVKEQERYSRDAKEQSTFKAGTQIRLAPVIKGTAGEVYTLFSQKEAASGQMTQVLPQVTILGPDGKQVVSTDMDYG